MKTYKLIKEYPGSPDLETISYKSSMSIYYKNGDTVLFNSSSSNPQYFEDMIENQPEFWQEIIEKDYEILSYSWEDAVGIMIYETDYFSRVNPLEDGYSINSIKRLSDGEVFTIGEKVNFQGNGCSGEHIINKFILKDDYIAVDGMVVVFPLKFIKKLKKLLFTTEDGVDIFEHDIHYPVELNYFKLHLNARGSMFSKSDKKKFKIFSTREKAEEYILMNKPCLSINEISDFYKSAKNNKSINSIRLIQFTKEKIKQ